MKTLFFLLSLFIMPLVMYAQTKDQLLDMWANPTAYLDKILAKRSIPPESLGYNERLEDDLQAMAFAISVEVQNAESPNWGTPSSERKAVIEKWGKILQPYTGDLVKLVFDKNTQDDSVKTQSRSLLDFAPPTEEFAEQVRTYIKESPWIAFRAADLLYEHRLLTDADKEALREWRPDAGRESDLERWATGMCVFGMPDGWAIVKKALSKKPQGETPEKITDQYLGFLWIASQLGPDAAILLPEIETLIANPLIISSGYLQKFEYARDVITGKEPRQSRYAINGSGPLAVKIGDSPQPKIQDNQSIKDTSLERPEKSRSPVDSKSSDVTAKETASWPWAIIVSFIVLLVVALVAWLKARKSKSNP